MCAPGAWLVYAGLQALAFQSCVCQFIAACTGQGPIRVVKGERKPLSEPCAIMNGHCSLCLCKEYTFYCYAFCMGYKLRCHKVLIQLKEKTGCSSSLVTSSHWDRIKWRRSHRLLYYFCFIQSLVMKLAVNEPMWNAASIRNKSDFSLSGILSVGNLFEGNSVNSFSDIKLFTIAFYLMMLPNEWWKIIPFVKQMF